MCDGWQLHTFAAISLSEQALLSIGLQEVRHTAAASGSHATGTPPPLRPSCDWHTAAASAFTRLAHRRPFGFSQIGVGAALGRGADPTRSRPKDSPGIQSIQPTHWLWLHRGSTTGVWSFQCLLPGESFGLDRGQGRLLPRFVKSRRGGGVPVGGKAEAAAVCRTS